MRLVETKVQWTLKSIDDSDLFLFMSHGVELCRPQLVEIAEKMNGGHINIIVHQP